MFYLEDIILAAAVVAVIVVAIVRLVRGEERFDERQKAARGKAYRAAFITTALLLVVSSIIVSVNDDGSLPFSLPIALFFSAPLMAGVLVLIAYMIASDSFFAGDVPIWAVIFGGVSVAQYAFSIVDNIVYNIKMNNVRQTLTFDLLPAPEVYGTAQIIVQIVFFSAEAAVFCLLVFKFVRGRRARRRSEANWRDGE